MKYLVILFLFLCEFTFGQIPGSPRFTGTIATPTVYTLGYTLAPDLSSASVTAQAINTGRIINATENNTGRYPIIESGILWGSGSVNINTYSGRISNGAINGDPFTRDITPLPEDGSISIVAYATTSAGTFYGKALNILQQKVRSPFTGKIWMTYNLGATALANVSQPRGDVNSYGHLYQWGRRSDGHQIILPLSNPGYDANGVATSGTAFSPVTTTLASSYTNTTSSYISSGADWTVRNDNLWQGINGLNNPCPAGFRVPTETDFTKESSNFSTPNAAGALNSFLMLPSAGLRSSAGILGNGLNSYFNYDVGRYWTSTVIGTSQARLFGFTSTALQATSPQRAFGYSVRCIQGDESSGGTAKVSTYSSISSSTGDLIAGVPISGVTQTISANVTTIGTYDIVAITNGITFTAKGTFAGTNTQTIVLTASGTPTQGNSSGTFTTFALNTIPSMSFTRTVSGASTNGTAEVGSYTPTSSTGTMIAGQNITGGVSQTISANVTTIGNYNIKAINNGVTFSASGTFTNTGVQNIVLNASGTPILSGTYTFSINTTPSTTFSNTTIHVSSMGTAVVSSYTLNTNNDKLRAGLTHPSENSANVVFRVIFTKAGTYNISTDNVNGVTFYASGVVSGTGTITIDITLAAAGTAIDVSAGNTWTFITNPSATFSMQTLADQTTSGSARSIGYELIQPNELLYLGVSSSKQRFAANISRPGTYNVVTNTVNGVTFAGSGTFTSTGINYFDLTSSGNPIAKSVTNTFTDNKIVVSGNFFSFNKEVANVSTNGQGLVSNYGIGSATGTMIAGNAVSGVSQTITANVSSVANAGSYLITTNTVNGVTYAGTGQLANGNNNITLTATGTPISSGTYSFTTNTTPSITFSNTTVEASTNGAAVVTNYTIGFATGTMIAGNPVSGVTQTITANVATAGNYTITTNTTNGVTYAGSGTFTDTGSQDIVLTAVGTPILNGTDNFIINTTPNVTFNATTVGQPSSGGSAIVSSYTSISSEGTMYSPTPVSSVRQTIRANVTRIGTYNLSTITNNGVTFVANGTFTSTGNNDITLVATGTPISTGTYTFTLNTTPGNNFNRLIIDRSSGGTALITWNGVSQSGITTEQTAENNRVIVREIEASTYNPPFVLYIAVNVTQIGTYNIETYGNRTNQGNTLRLVGSGTFTTTGVQTIPLYFYGAAVNNNGNLLNHYFYLPSESFNQYNFIKFSQ